MYVTVPSGLITTVPFAGSVTEPGVTVIGSPSGSKSLAKTTIATGIPTSVLAVSLFAIGASLSGPLIGNTSITTVAVSQA